ncbi:pheromone A receptor-domain-containing protein [Limtongia smithiae]|uniref:pheromone A receptor-domain-containing protein n=1 Tax=Limtongia smithiae TaxID=1125753 RepID=UPI0034CF6534
MIYVPIFATSLCSLVLSLISLKWHVRHRNIPAIYLIMWIILGSLCLFITSIPFGGPDVFEYWDGQGLCDVTTRIHAAAGMGVTTSIIGTSRTLALIMSSSSASLLPTRAQRRRDFWLYTTLSVFVPLLFIVFYFIAQSYRYLLTLHSGCMMILSSTWVSILIYDMWLPIFMFVASIYAMTATVRYFKRRREIREMLQYSQSNLNKARFIRMLIFNLTTVVVGLPFSLYVFIYNVTYGDFVAYHWSEVHSKANWSYIPRVQIQGSPVDYLLYPLLSGLLFLHFGFGSDAVGVYREWLAAIGMRRVFPKWKLFATDMGTDTSATIGSAAKSSVLSKQDAQIELFDILEEARGEKPGAYNYVRNEVVVTSGSSGDVNDGRRASQSMSSLNDLEVASNRISDSNHGGGVRVEYEFIVQR